MLNGRERRHRPASSEVELESLRPLVDSPASPDPQTPADDDTDDEYVDYCPYPTYPETPSANGLLARTERVTEGVRFDDWTKIAHPTNGVLVLVSRHQATATATTKTTAAWWMSVPKQSPPRQTRNEHVLYDSCRQRSERLFWRTNARGHGACVFGRL